MSRFETYIKQRKEESKTPTFYIHKEHGPCVGYSIERGAIYVLLEKTDSVFGRRYPNALSSSELVLDRTRNAQYKEQQEEEKRRKEEESLRLELEKKRCEVERQKRKDDLRKKEKQEKMIRLQWMILFICKPMTRTPFPF